jgi:hypothetical protein
MEIILMGGWRLFFTASQCKLKA